MHITFPRRPCVILLPQPCPLAQYYRNGTTDHDHTDRFHNKLRPSAQLRPTHVSHTPPPWSYIMNPCSVLIKITSLLMQYATSFLLCNRSFEVYTAVSTVRKDGARPQPIIVKFTSYRARQDVFMAKRRLTGTKVVITENLTRRRIDFSKPGEGFTECQCRLDLWRPHHLPSR